MARGQTAMSKPANSSARRVWVERIRPITEGRTVLPVIGHQTGADGTRWLRVRLPGRPNGSTGWIRKARTTRSSTAWHLVVDLSERRLTVYRSGRARPGVLGRHRKPLDPDSAREVLRRGDRPAHGRARSAAPYGLALSARSYVLQEFAGGPGQIAVHGVWNVGGRMGTAVSHGCVRLDTDLDHVARRAHRPRRAGHGHALGARSARRRRAGRPRRRR